MKDRYNAFNFACTWWGICHILFSCLLCYLVYILLVSNEAIYMKIVGVVLLLLGIGSVLLNGIDFIKKGKDKASTANDAYHYTIENRS